MACLFGPLFVQSIIGLVNLGGLVVIYQITALSRCRRASVTVR